MTDRIFLSTTPDGVARLEAGASTPTSRLETADIVSLSTGPPESGLVVAGSEHNGVSISRDRGATWSHAGLTGVQVMSVAVAPGDPDRLYAGVRPPGVYRSDDGGETWTECDAFRSIRGRRFWRSPASPPFTAYVQAIAVSPADPDMLVAGIEFGAVVRSTDGGESWSNHRRRAIRDCHSLAWHATDGTHVYEGGAGIRKRPGAVSVDGGDTWQKPGGGLDRGYGWAVAADPADPDCWYVSASTGPSAAHGGGDAKVAVFRRESRSGWNRVRGIPGDSMVYGLLTDPERPDHLWVGQADGSLWFSEDRGETVVELDSRLPAIDRVVVMLSPG